MISVIPTSISPIQAQLPPKSPQATAPDSSTASCYSKNCTARPKSEPSTCQCSACAAAVSHSSSNRTHFPPDSERSNTFCSVLPVERSTAYHVSPCNGCATGNPSVISGWGISNVTFGEFQT